MMGRVVVGGVLQLMDDPALAHQHAKGCHCKKSGCLKKYCECFQAGIVCGPNCKCLVRMWYYFFLPMVVARTLSVVSSRCEPRTVETVTATMVWRRSAVLLLAKRLDGWLLAR